MITIGFLTPTINIRGTCVSIYDYAHYNETLLHNKSIIITQKIDDNIAYRHFKNRFQVLIYTNNSELDNLIQNNKIIIVYHIKYGKNDSYIPKYCFNVIHCVFDMTEPHGDVYAAVSKTLANKFNKHLYVPHMVSMTYDPLQQNLRKELHIPDNACVFGRYGGLDTWNLSYTWSVLTKILNEFDDVYILLINTPTIQHKRVINLEPITDIRYKKLFINTCNAMICPESLGHTFGLTCAEFASQQKPIIVYNGDNVWNKHHLDVIGDKGIYFQNRDQFEKVLIEFYNNRSLYISRKDLNVYSEFTPESVMKIFNQVFIQPFVSSC